METVNTKVAIYCRLSEEDRFKAKEGDDSCSIKNQKAMLAQYCVAKGWEIYKIYSDDDFTGSDRKRPAFNELLNDAENKKFNIVLCKTQSRFTRELELVEKYINYLFPVWGIRFISIVDNADTDVKGNKKSRQINGLVNEWYLEDMSENIKAVLTNRRQNGFFIGAFAPYGYKKDPNQKGHLIIDERAAEVVKLIYDLYLSGKGRTAIARELNNRHIPTPTDYKIANGERYKNNHTATHDHLWRYFMISNVLTNETYIGNLVQNKAHSISYKTKIIKPTKKNEWIRVEGTHEPIIDKETWLKAQNILNSRSKPTFNSDFQNIFSSKVKCGLCGANMKISKMTDGRRYLRCGARYYAPESCKGTNLRYKVLYDTVLQEFQEIVRKYADENTINSELELEDNLEKKRLTINTEIKEVEKKINDNTLCMKNLYLDKVKSIIDEETYKSLNEDFVKDRNKLTKERQRLIGLLNEVENDIKNKRTKLNIIKDYLNIQELTFDFVQTFIDKIEVYEKPAASREYNFKIFWNF